MERWIAVTSMDAAPRHHSCVPTSPHMSRVSLTLPSQSLTALAVLAMAGSAWAKSIALNDVGGCAIR